MAIIRASCPDCGDVETTPDQMKLSVCGDDLSRMGYSFPCPACNGIVIKDTNQRIFDLLVSSGVRVEIWKMPYEMIQADQLNRFFKATEPLTHDHLLEFHELLQTSDWFSMLESM